jgi:hypothetical protein
MLERGDFVVIWDESCDAYGHPGKVTGWPVGFSDTGVMVKVWNDTYVLHKDLVEKLHLLEPDEVVVTFTPENDCE